MMNAINTYQFEELQLGMKESFDIMITKEMMENFCAMTGDVNPLHQDERFAKENGFQNRVVYGMLTSSFLSKLIGVYLPGKNSLIYDTKISYLKPAYIGDCLTIMGELTDKQELYRMIVVRCTIFNQRGEKIVKGKITVKVLK